MRRGRSRGRRGRRSDAGGRSRMIHGPEAVRVARPSTSTTGSCCSAASSTPRRLVSSATRGVGTWRALGADGAPDTHRPRWRGASFVYDEAHDVSVLFGKGGTWLLEPGSGRRRVSHVRERRRRVHVRRRALLRQHRRNALEPADRRDRPHPDAQGLLARRSGWWCVHVRRCALLRQHGRYPPRRNRSSRSRRLRRVVATGSSRATAGSSRSAMRPTSGAPANRTSRPNRSSASPPRSTAHGYMLVARDGQVFAFGDVRCSAAPTTPPGAARRRHRPQAATFGYWIVNQTGRVFTYATEKFGNDERDCTRRSSPSSPARPRRGYWLFGRRRQGLRVRRRAATTATRPPTSRRPSSPRPSPRSDRHFV